MKIGISVTSGHPRAEARQGAGWMVDRTRAAWRAGLDTLFVGDHHHTSRPYYQNSPILGRMLAEWGDRPCGALYLLPLWHPVIVAEQVGTLASIAQGRFILQCAIGPSDHQFAGMGIDPRHRPSRFEESLSILRRLWNGETVDADGRFHFAGARVSPTPPEPVEVWIGASVPPAIDRAARLGEGWIAAPGLTPAEARQQVRLYREACDLHGRVPTAVTIRRDIYLGDSAEEAQRTAGPVVEAGYRGFPKEATVVGDAAHLTEAFLELADMGYTDVIVRNLVGDPEAAVACIDRLAEVRQAVANA